MKFDISEHLMSDVSGDTDLINSFSIPMFSPLPYKPIQNYPEMFTIFIDMNISLRLNFFLP